MSLLPSCVPSVRNPGSPALSAPCRPGIPRAPTCGISTPPGRYDELRSKALTDPIPVLRPYLTRAELTAVQSTGTVPATVAARAMVDAMTAAVNNLTCEYDEEFWRRYEAFVASARAQLGLQHPDLPVAPVLHDDMYDQSTFC